MSVLDRRPGVLSWAGPFAVGDNVTVFLRGMDFGDGVNGRIIALTAGGVMLQLGGTYDGRELWIPAHAVTGLMTCD